MWWDSIKLTSPLIQFRKFENVKTDVSLEKKVKLSFSPKYTAVGSRDYSDLQDFPNFLHRSFSSAQLSEILVLLLSYGLNWNVFLQMHYWQGILQIKVETMTEKVLFFFRYLHDQQFSLKHQIDLKWHNLRCAILKWEVCLKCAVKIPFGIYCRIVRILVQSERLWCTAVQNHFKLEQIVT